MPVTIKRVYKAQSRYNSRFGFGWDLNVNKQLVAVSGGDIYYLNGDNNCLRFKYFNGTDFTGSAHCFDELKQNSDGTYTLTEKTGTTYTFNTTGTLKEITDRNSNKIQFQWDAEGKLPLLGVPLYSTDQTTERLVARQYKLDKIIDTLGREITFTYNSQGRLSLIRDFDNREIKYEYDTLGHLTSVTDPLNNKTTYTYDSDRNLRSIIDSKNQTYVINTYNALEQVIAQEYGNETFYFSYDTTNKTTTYTDRKGDQWTYYFDDNGNATKLKDPQARETSFIYDFNNKMIPISKVYPAGNSELYAYDSKGNLTRVTRRSKNPSQDPDLTTTFTYTTDYNQIKTITDPNAKTTTFDYDTKGNLINITYPADLLLFEVLRNCCK